jgi:phage repressor protein C with HTH and peptisase S24 domain
MNTIGERIKEIRSEAGMTGVEFGNVINVSKAYISQLESGVRTNLDRLKIEAIARRFSVNIEWLEHGKGPKRFTELTASQTRLINHNAAPARFEANKEKVEKSNAIPIGVKLVPVFGMAQALGYKPHHGDVIPDDIYSLPKVVVMDDGRDYAAFKVEGRSMEPTLVEGVIVLCDIHLEPTNKCIVCIKWDDTVCVKRYRRVNNHIMLTSDNPTYGEEYNIQAEEVDWCLRVRRVIADLP